MVEGKALDKSQEIEYNNRKLLMTEIKSIALKLSKAYGENLKIEIDTNPATLSAKMKVTFFNL